MTEQTLPPQHDDVLLETRAIGRRFDTPGGTVHALQDITLTVRQREMLGIMGASGSGKSTLLFILGLLLHPTAGTYTLLGRDMLVLNRKAQAAFRRTSLGFIFQSADMVETCSVYENLELPLIYASVKRSQRRPRIMEALRRVDLSHRAEHPANLLSGGERQRAALARALVNRPKLILADEPTGQLDRSSGRRVMEYLARVAEEGAATVIVVTHDPEVVSRCSRICELKEGILHET